MSLSRFSEPALHAARSAYQQAMTRPVLEQCKLAKATPTSDALSILTTWKLADLSVQSSTRLGVNAVLQPASSTITRCPPQTLFPGSRMECANSSRSVVASLRRQRDADNKDWQELLEVTVRTEGHSARRETFHLQALELHGDVYFDKELGGMSVNEQGTHLVYVAEAKKPKPGTFFPTTKQLNQFEKDKVPQMGQETKFKDEFGEQLTGKANPVIVVLQLQDFSFSVLEKFPYDSWSPGQLVLHGQQLLGIGVAKQPRHLGLIYCSNRPSVLFRLDLGKKDDEQEVQFLRGQEEKGPKMAVKFPRISKQGTLIWLEYNLPDQGGEKCYPGPHANCFRLAKLDLESSNPKPEVQVIAEDLSEGYSGIPARCFTEDGRHAIFSTVVKDTFFPVLFPLEGSLKETRQDKLANVMIQDVLGDVVVGSHSTLLEETSVRLFKFEDGALTPLPSQPLTFYEDDPAVPAFLQDDFIYQTLDLKPINPHPVERFRHVDFSALYFGPAADSSRPKASVPLILWPHGGPHSAITNQYLNTASFFRRLGYAMLFVNYRGSLGNGQDGVDALPGHVGSVDVEDCAQARGACLTRFPSLDPSKVVLFGGSHGGFLVTHLAGQHPSEYRAVAARNPVVNLASMATTSDIPDWVSVESGFDFNYGPASAEKLPSMYRMSPIAHAEMIVAPVLLLVGQNDLRVPPSQSYEYYHYLKALGKTVEMHVYDDCHPLSKGHVEPDVLVNTALFFHRALNNE